MPTTSIPPYERKITFAETDAAGVAHFSKLAVLVEEAIHSHFQQRGIAVIDPMTAWPIVSLHIDYKSPLRFGDKARIHLNLEKAGTASLTWTFEAHSTQEEATPPAFKGTLTQCHLDPASGSPTPIPEKIQILLRGSK